MRLSMYRLPQFFAVCLMMVMSAEASAQGFGKGAGRGGPPGDKDFPVDRSVFQYLLSHHDEIRREVRNTENGVETITQSDNADVAKKIQEHAVAMHKRVVENRGIHRRDPLFAEIFRHTDKIEMKVEKIDKGVKVVETSNDPYVAKLIQAHAQVVSDFVAHGHEEVHKNHQVPARTKPVDGKTSASTDENRR